MSQAKRIEAILLKGGAYVRDICKEVGIANNSFHAIYTDYIKKRHDVRRIHIPAWDKSSYIVIGQEAEDAFRAMVKAELPKRLEEKRKERNARHYAQRKTRVSRGYGFSKHDAAIKKMLAERRMTSNEVAQRLGLAVRSAAVILRTLVAREEIFTRLLKQGPNGLRMWSGSREMIEEGPNRVVQKRPRKSQNWKESGITEWSAPVVVKERGLVGDIVIPEGVKITRCHGVSFDVRYSLPPGSVVNGEFSRLGIGRYLESM